VQRVAWNLLYSSEQFVGTWSTGGATITANVANAPNGTLTADSFSITSAASSYIYRNAAISVTVFTASVYVKYVDRQFIQILFGSGLTQYANFDIRNGVVTGGTYTGAAISDAGNGWFRISITTTGTTPGSVDTYIWAIDSGTALRAAANSGSGSYNIWGAQLTEGSSALEYFPTTDRQDVPRIDYSLGGCPTLLMEPQRTNINLQSEDFSGWNKLQTTVAVNTTIAPSGILTADSLLETAVPNQHIAFTDTVALSGTQYTFSIYAKSIGGRNIQVLGSSGFSGSVMVDLSNGNILSGSGVVSNVGNGWFRISITATTTTTVIRIILYSLDGTTTSFVGDVTKGVSIWGAQIEAGAYPTSYIPTTSASVTRNADSFVRNNIYSNGLISASGGTWLIELKNNIPMPRVGGYPTLFLSDSLNGATGTVIGLFSSNSLSRLSLYFWQSGVFTNIGVTSTDNLKVAFTWTPTTLKVFVNGVLTNTYTGLTWNITTIQNLVQISEVTLYINKMYLYPTPISDAECINITK
jgi:hypothetical protein